MTGGVTPITRARSFPATASARSSGDRVAVLLLLPVAVLLLLGLGAMLSASSVVAFREQGDHLFFFKRQIIWTVAGIAAMFAAARIPYRWYGRWAPALFTLSLGGLVATLALGEVRNGARRWIDVGPISIQSSEFTKFAVIVFLAAVLSRKESWLHDFPHFFWPVAGSLGLTGVLLLAQPNLGTMILVMVAAFAVIIASKTPMRFVFGVGTVGALLGLAVAYAKPYRRARLTSFLDPLADPLGDGLQAVQSLVALGTGSWFGVGLGASRARWFFLPNAHTDFIFAIIGEETGLAGSLTVVALFLAFTIVGTRIAFRAPDPFGRLVAIGIVAWISVQALVNIGGVTAVLPITGVPLPFISSGGSAMIANLAAVGVLINIARSSERTSRAHWSDVRP